MRRGIDSLVPVRASAAGEIFWALERVERHYKRIRRPRLDLPKAVPLRVQRRVAEFWSDGASGFVELMVLADWAGAVFGDDPRAVIDAVLAEPPPKGPAPAFTSELAEERVLLHRRLDRLAADAELRRRYGAMLREAWAYFDPAWRAEGRQAVADSCALWTARLVGSSLEEVLPEHHVVHTMGLGALLQSALDQGRAVLSPGYFFGNSHAFDLASVLSIGIGIEQHPLDHRFRISGHIVAGQLAAIANPDRATVLTALFAGHRTVAELALACGLSPAAVRRHLAVLRRADLVVAAASDPVEYEVVEAGVERLFNDSNARLLGSAEQAGRRYWERLAAAADYRAIFDGATVGILQLDLEGNCLTCNPAAERLFAAGAAQLSQLSSQRLLADPLPQDPFVRGPRREVRLRRPTEGTVFWAAVTLAEVRDPEGRPRFRYAMVEDLTERRRAEEALRESEHRFRTVFRQAGIGIAQVAPGGEIREVNPALARMLGMLEPGLAGRPLAQYLRLDESEPSFLAELWSGGRDESHGEGRLLDGRGQELWVSVSASLVRDEEGAPTLAVVLLEDISGRKAHEQLLAHRALHDPLTDLPNRALFRDRLDLAMRAAHRGQTDLAVLMLDLDGFKEVNDRHGHQQGDRVLIEVARRLVGAVRESDTVARLGGDEFAVLLPHIAGAAGIERATRHLQEALREPLLVGGLSFQVGASVGGALHSSPGGDADALLEAADAAMYRAKRAGAGFQLA